MLFCFPIPDNNRISSISLQINRIFRKENFIVDIIIIIGRKPNYHHHYNTNIHCMAGHNILFFAVVHEYWMFYVTQLLLLFWLNEWREQQQQRKMFQVFFWIDIFARDSDWVFQQQQQQSKWNKMANIQLWFRERKQSQTIFFIRKQQQHDWCGCFCFSGFANLHLCRNSTRKNKHKSSIFNFVFGKCFSINNLLSPKLKTGSIFLFSNVKFTFILFSLVNVWTKPFHLVAIWCYFSQTEKNPVNLLWFMNWQSNEISWTTLNWQKIFLFLVIRIILFSFGFHKKEWKLQKILFWKQIEVNTRVDDIHYKSSFVVVVWKTKSFSKILKISCCCESNNNEENWHFLYHFISFG